jgi:hypothetical protein
MGRQEQRPNWAAARKGRPGQVAGRAGATYEFWHLDAVVAIHGGLA